MKLHDYLESTYVQTNIALQQVYSPYGQGKIMATQGLINGQRKVLTCVNYVVILFNYLLVLAHIKSAPLTAHDLVAKLKAESEKRLEDQKTTINLERQAQIDAHLALQKAESNVTPIKGE